LGRRRKGTSSKGGRGRRQGISAVFDLSILHQSMARCGPFSGGGESQRSGKEREELKGKEKRRKHGR